MQSDAITVRDPRLAVQYKGDGSPSTNADLAAEHIIREGLRELGYSFRFEGEETEMEADEGKTYEIIIDGIDGTRNFRDGNPGWCVSAAVRTNGNIAIGVIHDPEAAETYYAEKGGGAFVARRGVTKPCVCPSALPGDFSFSIGSFRVRGSTAIKNLITEDIKKLGGRGREWGCVALSICAVARGGLGIFIQGNSHFHDHVAALLIAEEAGAQMVVRTEGKGDSADVVVCHPSLFQRTIQIFESRTAGQRDVK